MVHSADKRRPLFIRRHALIGLAGGVAMGIVARICGESAWWWLAVPIAPLVFGFNRDDSTSGRVGSPRKSASATLDARELETIAEFQERRREAGRRVRPSAIAMVLGFGVLYFCPGIPETTGAFWLCALAFAVVAGAIFHMTFIWKRFYRCPACEEPVLNPLSQGGDVPLNPRACPHCGARLA